MNSIVYKYKDNLYLNITNRCPVRCKYCIKYSWKMKFRGYNLYLNKEPSFKCIVKKLKKSLKIYPETKEIVFCGYGEPLLRWDIVKKICIWLRQNYPNLKIRLNTNGLGNSYNRFNVLRQLKGLIDIVSISLNAHNQKTYNLLHKTKIKSPFKKIIKFIKQARKLFPNVIITTISHPLVNIEKVKKLSKNLKVKFKKRKYLEKYEER